MRKAATGKRKPASARERITAYRRRMRAAGYRPVEIWVPDVRNTNFVKSFRSQCTRVAARERADHTIEAWLDANAGELLREIERVEEARGAPDPSWGRESPP